MGKAIKIEDDMPEFFHTAFACWNEEDQYYKNAPYINTPEMVVIGLTVDDPTSSINEDWEDGDPYYIRLAESQEDMEEMKKKGYTFYLIPRKSWEQITNK